jgi:hypothetical protein
MKKFSAIAELRRQLELPVIGRDDPQHWSVEETFDPWEIFPMFYGSYDSEFDDMAIEVLEAVREGNFRDEPLSHRMFREVLCTSDLCDYGTSPRGCFPNWDTRFAEVLPRLIEKWKQYRSAEWGDDE